MPRLPLDPDVEPGASAAWDVLLAIAAGGAVGSLGRWGLAELLHGTGPFPWATLVVNVVGSFALGALVVLAFARWPGSRYLRPLLGVGVLGGFTTFSTYVLDVRTLVADDRSMLAIAYLAATLLLGLAAAWVGMAAARRVAVW